MIKEFDKIIGYEPVKKELEIICDTLRNGDKYKQLGVKTPKGLLLHGAPGLGKTLIANCILEASGRNVYICRKEKMDDLFKHRMDKIFKDAKENAPSIILFDDMDKFANDGPMHRNSDAFIAIQSFIDDCKNDEVFVVATCNELHCLPDSLLRAGRFDKLIKLTEPKGEDAINIVKYYLSQKNNVGDVDANEIAKILNGRSCAELEMVVNEAGIYAGFANKKTIEMEDMIKSCIRVIFNAPESMSDINPDEIKSTAYHEAGHTVIAEILEPGSVSIVSVRKHIGEVGGITSLNLPDEYWHNKELMENRVVTLLGGKAATEVKFGRVDVGANSDLHRAFRIVDRFVDNYCSYGFDKFVLDRASSNDLLSRKEGQIYAEMDRYYAKSKKILVDNIEFLNKLAEALIQNETLVAKDIKAIKESCSAGM